MQQRVMPRDVDRVRRKVGQAISALTRVEAATGHGLFVRAKQQLGVARGALDGVERILEEMEFHAAHMEQTEGRE